MATSPEEQQFNSDLNRQQNVAPVDPDVEQQNRILNAQFQSGASQEEILETSRQLDFSEDKAYDTMDFLGQDLTDLMGKAKTTENIRNLAVPQAVVLGNLDTDNQSLQSLRSDPDIKTTVDEMFLKNIDEAREDIRTAFNEAASFDPFDVKDLTFAVADIDKELMDNAEQPGGLEKQVIETIAPFDFQAEKLKFNQLQLMMANDLADMYDDNDWFDLTQDFLGFTAPFGIVLDQIDLQNSEKLNLLIENPEGTLEGLIRSWHSLDVDRKLEYWPTLKDEILESTKTQLLGKDLSDGNVLKALLFTSFFMDPENGPENAQFDRRLDIALGGIDALGLSSIISGISVVARNHIKSSHIAKIANEVGNKKMATDISTTNVIDPDTARVSGLNHQEAVNIVDPVKTVEEFSPEKIDGITPQVLQNLNEFARLRSNTLSTFSEDADRLRYSLTTTPEREFLIRKEIDKLANEPLEDYLIEQGFTLDNIIASKINDVGADISFQISKTDSLGNLQQSEFPAKKITWKINDVTGNFDETVEALENSALLQEGSKLVMSPSFIARAASSGKDILTDFQDTFRAASNLDDIQELDRKLLTNVLKESLQPYSRLNKQSKKNVDDVLIAGDEYINPETAVRGREWTINELRSGIIQRPGGGTIRLTTDDEIEAYLRNRMFTDMMFEVQNAATRRQYEVTNTKSIKGLEELDSLAKVYDRKQDAVISDVTKPGVEILDRRIGEMVPYSPELLEEAYEQGYKLSRLNQANRLPDDIGGINDFYNFILTHSDDIGDLPRVVNHKKTGYVPKQNKGVEFLVKERTSAGRLNGSDYGNPKTLRFVSNKADGVKIIKELIDQDTLRITNDPELTDVQKVSQLESLKDKYSIVADRELTPEQKLSEGMGWSGGPFNKARSSEDILYGLRGIQTERFSPLEVYQRELNQIVPYLSRNEWRLGEQQRWLNSVNNAMGDLVDIKGFNTTNLPKDHPKTAALETLRNQIRTWTAVPTQQETLWSSTLQGIHDWTLWGARGLGFSNKESVKSVLWFKHKDPFSALKAATFHTTLGLLNPVQLYVQSQAATVAAARFPKEASRSMGYAFKMAMLDKVENASANGRVVSMLTDADTPLIKEVHNAWSRTGFRDSVRTNADITSMELGLGNSLNAYKKAIDSGLFFYRAGELFNRRFSFTSSYLNWKKANKNAIPNDDQLKEIMGDAKISMLELNRANAARFQGGPDASFWQNSLGLMFQFGQVATKTLELAAKGKARGGFSGAEKGRILFAQLALFGFAGVPFINTSMEYMLETTGIPKETLPPEAVTQWNGGFTELLTRHAMGADVDIGSRASIASNMTTFLADLVDGSEGISWQTAGAFGSLGTRVGKLMQQGIFPVLDKSGEDREITLEDLAVVGKLLAEIPTSSRNVIAALLMNKEQRIFDGKGNIVANGDLNFATQVMTGFGFSPSRKSEAFERQADNYDAKAQIKAVSDVYFSMIRNSALFGDGDHPSANGLDVADAYLFKKLDKALHQQVRDNIRDRIMNPTTLEERTLKDWYKRQIIDPITGILIEPLDRSLSRQLTTKKPLQQPLGPQTDLSDGE